MITLLFCFILLACIVFYFSSIENNSHSGIHYLYKHALLSRIIGVFLLLVACALCILKMGTWNGILFSLLSIMVCLSFLIILLPMKILNFRSVVMIVLFSFIVEFIFL